MTSYRSGMDISIHEFFTLIERRVEGTPLGRGWGLYMDQNCEECGFTWDHHAIVGSKGRICPRCGAIEPDWLWQGMDNQMPCDGAWLDPVGWQKARIIQN